MHDISISALFFTFMEKADPIQDNSCSKARSQAYAEAIPYPEEGTFQTQPPSHQYCYRYLDDANRTVIEVI